MIPWIIAIAIIYAVIMTLICVWLWKRNSKISDELRSEMDKTSSLRATLDRRDKLIADLKRIENETEKKKESYHTGDNRADFDKSVSELRNLPKKSKS
jgi:hypothetical protein